MLTFNLNISVCYFYPISREHLIHPRTVIRAFYLLPHRIASAAFYRQISFSVPPQSLNLSFYFIFLIDV